MNFAMALLVYGLAYFMFKSIKDDTKLLNAIHDFKITKFKITFFFTFKIYNAPNKNITIQNI